MADDDKLPVGRYQLADGRQFVGLDDFQLRAAAREDQRRQAKLDLALDRKLAAMPRPAPVKPERPRFGFGTTGDLFASLPAPEQPQGGGSSRANAREGAARTPCMQDQRKGR